MKNNYLSASVIANTLMRIFAVSKSEENRVALQQEIADALCWDQIFLTTFDLLAESENLRSKLNTNRKKQLSTPEWSFYLICESIHNLIPANDINRWCSVMQLDFNVIWCASTKSYVVFSGGIYIFTATVEFSQPQGEQQNG